MEVRLLKHRKNMYYKVTQFGHESNFFGMGMDLNMYHKILTWKTLSDKEVKTTGCQPATLLYQECLQTPWVI
jgi:hypothetical protein